MTFARIFKLITVVFMTVFVVGAADAAVMRDPRGGPSIAPQSRLSYTLSGLVNNNVVGAMDYVGQTGTGGGDTGGGGGGGTTATPGECKKVMSCFSREDACGETFEYCATPGEFAARKIACNNHLSACSNDEIEAFFGVGGTANDPKPGSLIMLKIDEAALNVSGNFFKRCEKTATNCFRDICTKNPNLCVMDSDIDDDKKQASCVWLDGNSCPSNTTPKRVITGACRAVIGTSADCRGQTGETDIDDVFESVYTAYFPIWRGTTLLTMLTEFDAKVLEQCQSNLETCIRQSCGSGNALVCHQQAVEGGGNLDGPKIKTLIGSACNNTLGTDAACSYSTKAKGVVLDTVLAEAATAFAGRLKNMFDMNTANKVEQQCMATVQGCVEDKCGENYYGCMKIAAEAEGEGVFDLRVRLNDKAVKAFCWNEVMGDSNCDTYFQIVGAKNNPSALASWSWSTAAVGSSGISTTGTGDSAVEVQNDAAFAQILRMLENLATSRRESDYSSRMNRCTKQGNNNIMWGEIGNNDGGSTSQPTPPTTMRLSDTCWSKVTLTVDTSEPEINKRLKKKTFDSYWVPSGESFTCGEWLSQNIFDGNTNLQRYTMDDVNAKELLPDWLKIGAATVAGMGLGGVAGNMGSKALGFTKGAANPQLVTKISGWESLISGSASPANASTMVNNLNSIVDNITDEDKKAATMLGNISKFNDENNAIVIAAMQSIVKDGSTTGEEDATKKTQRDNAVRQINAALNSARSALATAKQQATGDGAEDLDKLGMGVTIAGMAGGGFLAWKAAYDISEKGDKTELEQMNNALIANIAQNMTCTVTLYGGGTKKISLGESFTVPSM